MGQTEIYKQYGKYIEVWHGSKEAVANAYMEALRQLHEDWGRKEGEKETNHVAIRKYNASNDVQNLRVIKYAEGNTLVQIEDTLGRWKAHFNKLQEW